MRVKALQSMYYGKRMRAVDEEYDMDDREGSEANILAALGKIEILKPKLEARVMKAEAPQPVQQAEEPKSTPVQPMGTESADALTGNRRVYRRRDLKAER